MADERLSPPVPRYFCSSGRGSGTNHIEGSTILGKKLKNITVLMLSVLFELDN